MSAGRFLPHELLGATVRGDGTETLIFLNGFGTEQSVWHHQVNRFRSDYRTLTFDHVGSGLSIIDSYSASGYASLYDYADDVLALIDEVVPGPFSLVGHSVGGTLGAIVAIAEPDRCRRLMMIGASPCYLNAPGYPGGFEPSDIEAVLDAMAADYQSWIIGYSAKVASNPERPGVASAFAEFLRSLRPDIAQATLKTIFYSDLRPIIPKVPVPTLVVQASADIAVPAAVGRYLADTIPNARLCEIAHAGHLPHMLEPAAITALIADFLGDEPEGGG